MQLYMQDKAIEFSALYTELERRINNLKQIGIDVSEEERRILEIKSSCDAISNGATQVAAETTYQDGINQLKQVKEVLKRHEVYYSSYNQAENIQAELDKPQLNREKISLFAKSTITLLNQIQSSDTRSYNSEKAVVEKIYCLAYNTIKMELITQGRSDVLDWVRNDEIASSFINRLIEIDIALLDENSITNDVVKDAISMLKSSSTACSYLNEGLIMFIAMQDEKNLERVESSLLEVIREINVSDDYLTNVANDNDGKRNAIEALKATLKNNKIYKELALAISLFFLISGLKYGSEKLSTTFGHKEYKTNVDYFSSIEDAEAPSYPEYMSKIDNFGKTTLTACDVWRQEYVFFGDYNRDIVTYDLSDIDIDALEDFLTYDFSAFTPRKKTTETAEELDANELYDKAIVEIIRFSQDENDTIFVPNKEVQEAFLVCTSTVLTILHSLGLGWIIINILKKLKSNHETRVLKRKQSKELTSALKSYKLLCAENEEFKNKFLEMYQLVAQFIKNPKIEEQYKRILSSKKSE